MFNLCIDKMVSVRIERFNNNYNQLRIYGWAFDDNQEVEATVYLDNKRANCCFSTSERKDIFDIYNTTNALNSGFSLVVDDFDSDVNIVKIVFYNDKYEVIDIQEIDTNKFIGYNKFIYLTKEEIITQKSKIFNHSIKFSIVVPLYNTPENFLTEMIDSVVNQTYSNWELCMADGSTDKFDFVGEICNNYAKNDDRIRYKKLEKNLGISENTNACIEMSTGDYIGLFDHDDLLHMGALFEVATAIENENADFIYTDEMVFDGELKNIKVSQFKSDFAIDTLRSINYICHFTIFKKSLLEITGGFNRECDGSQDYDIILKLTEVAQTIHHIPKILYYWRCHTESVASDISAKPYVIDAAKKALTDHLKRCNLNARVLDSKILSSYKIEYEIKDNDLVSIIIPNKDHKSDLKLCIESVLNKTTYKNYEIIVIENNSESDEIFRYYDKLKQNDKIKIVYYEGEFNFSLINNFGVEYATGDYYILLNNDIEIITPNWIEEMLMLCQRDDVGIVGSMLYYPDDTIQHAGVIVGIGNVAGHSHKCFNKFDYGHMGRLTYSQNLSAVTGACLMIKKSVFDEVGGLDEKFKVAFNDVDLCLRVREKGYLICWTPYAKAYHYESKSRGYEDTHEKVVRFQGEVDLFRSRWKEFIAKGDPYYNMNLTLEREDFSLK